MKIYSNPREAQSIIIQENLQMGIECIRQENFQEAIMRFQTILYLSPIHFAGHFHIARSYFYLNNHSRARYHFKKALQLNIDAVNSWINYGSSCVDKSNYEKDNYCLLESISQEKDSIHLQQFIAQILFENRSYTQAKFCLEEILIKEPGNIQAKQQLKKIQKQENYQLTFH